MAAPLCHRCPLSRLVASGPVPSEMRDVPVSIVVDAPGEREVDMGLPLVGPHGVEVQRAFDALGVGRDRFCLHHAIACRIPEGKLDRVRLLLKRENREREKQGVEPLLDPVVACRPRLLAEIKDHAVLMGKTAYEAVVKPADGRHIPSLDEVAGNLSEPWCHDDRQRRIVVTHSPARVLQAARWRLPFRAGLSRALRWFYGGILWTEPAIVTQPPAAWLRDTFLPWCAAQPWVAFDTETNALEPLLAQLRTIQIGTGDVVVVVALAGMDGAALYAPDEDAEIRATLADWLPRLRLVGHNAGSYDLQVIQQNLGCTPNVVLDTVLLHRYVDPDLPHTLGFVGSYYTDVHAWKADSPATHARSDAELWRYGALDVAVNARILPPLLARFDSQHNAVYHRSTRTLRPQGGIPTEGIAGLSVLQPIAKDPILLQDHAMQRVCVEMHGLGVRVDQAKREAHDRRLTEHLARGMEWLQGVVEASGAKVPAGFDAKGEPLFNPNSTDQVKALLFGEWDLPFPDYLPKNAQYTASGERASDDTILRAYMADLTLSPEQHCVIHAIRRVKKIGKLLGSFVRKLAPWSAEDDPNKRLAVWPDGRLRVNWNAHGTNVGRLSSGGRPSKINLQTIPSSLRDVFVPEEGHVFVGADLSSVHLRIIANLWQIPSLLDDYRYNRDPHVTLASIIYEGFDSVPGAPCDENNNEWTGQAKVLRNTAKSLRYAGAYGALVPTIHATMTRAEDEHGNLRNRTMTVAQVQGYYERWMGREPEWRRAWDNERALFRANGFSATPILGRRADFADGEDPNAIINYRIIATEGDLMGTSTVRVRNRIPPHAWGRNTGLIAQIPDQIVLEVPEHRAKEAREMLEAEMNVQPHGWEIPITADGKIGTDMTFKHDPTR